MADKKVETPVKDAEKKETPKVDIIRGRMPLLIVSMIKFGNDGVTDGALAAKYRTTNGKVSDIRKNRNFGYITKDFVPTADMIEGAQGYADQLADKDVAKAVKDTKPASDKQTAAFEELRKASRPGRKAAEKPAEAAGSGEDSPKDELEGLTE